MDGVHALSHIDARAKGRNAVDDTPLEKLINIIHEDLESKLHLLRFKPTLKCKKRFASIHECGRKRRHLGPKSNHNGIYRQHDIAIDVDLIQSEIWLKKVRYVFLLERHFVSLLEVRDYQN